MLRFFLFLLLFFLLFLIFCPIKLKFKILATEKNLEVYFYKFKLFSLMETIHKREEKCSEYKDSKCTNSSNNSIANKNRKHKKMPKKKSGFSIDIKKLISLLYSNKFKPKLKLSFNLKYSTEDAALTALLFGLIHQGTSFLYLLLESFFNLKKFTKEIVPEFNDINSLLFEIESIITLNFAQIIYIGILYFIKNKL